MGAAPGDSRRSERRNTTSRGLSSPAVCFAPDRDSKPKRATFARLLRGFEAGPQFKNFREGGPKPSGTAGAVRACVEAVLAALPMLSLYRLCQLSSHHIGLRIAMAILDLESYQGQLRFGPNYV